MTYHYPLPDRCPCSPVPVPRSVYNPSRPLQSHLHLKLLEHDDIRLWCSSDPSRFLSAAKLAIRMALRNPKGCGYKGEQNASHPQNRRNVSNLNINHEAMIDIHVWELLYMLVPTKETISFFIDSFAWQLSYLFQASLVLGKKVKSTHHKSHLFKNFIRMSGGCIMQTQLQSLSCGTGCVQVPRELRG